jgi:beta-glucosidase
VGDVPGDEVVQLYLHDRESTITRPVKQLTGFKRVTLEPGESCWVGFSMKMNQLGFYNRAMQFVVEPGNMDVMIGNSSADIHLTGEFEIIGDVSEVMGKRSFSADISLM